MRLRQVRWITPLGCGPRLRHVVAANLFFARLICGAAEPTNTLELANLVVTNGMVIARWDGARAPYQVQKRTNFVSPWVDWSAPTWSGGMTNILTEAMVFYRVRAGEDLAPDFRAPTPPLQLSGVPVSSRGLTLRWGASVDPSVGSGVKGYLVSRGGLLLQTVLAPLTSTTDIWLAPATTYRYEVRAYDFAGNLSDWSLPFVVTIPQPDTTPPSVPTGLTVSAINCSQLDLSWNASTDTGGSGLRGYYIYRNGAFLKEVIGTNSTSDSGLAASTRYSYAVASVDKDGNQSAQTAPVSNITPSCPDVTAPSVPTGLTATAISRSQINLAWNASTDTGGSGLGGYRVFRNGAFEASTIATSYSRTGLTPGTFYCFSVAAYDNAFNTSAQSDLACATTQPPCSYTLSAIRTSYPTNGGSDSVTVTTAADCSWSASSDDAWITITDGASGTGNGTVTYSVAANTNASPRIGVLRIAGQTFTITQLGQGAPCTLVISPTNTSVGEAGGSGTLTVATGPGCSWTVSSSEPAWLTAMPASGAGSGTVTWSVAANTATTSRSGTLTIGGQTFTVAQAAAACTYTISSSSASFPSAGGSGSVSVTANSGCAWTAVSFSSWITIVSQTGMGNGTVVYSVAANPSTSPRSGALAIAGQTFIIHQAGMVDTTSPTASLTSPANFATVSNTITISASASDDVGIARVDFYVESVLLGIDANEPYTIAFDTTTIPNGPHGFYCKAYDAAGNFATSATNWVAVQNAPPPGGLPIWARVLSGTNQVDFANPLALAVDSSGNVIVAGQFLGRLDFAGGSLTNAGQTTFDIFLAKFSPSGSLIWSNRFGSEGNEIAFGVAVDPSNNILLTGYFNPSLDFGTGALPYNRNGDGFLAKFSPSGFCIWAKSFGGAGSDVGKAVATDGNANIFVTGYFGFTGNAGVPGEPADFGGGSITNRGDADIFVAKYSPSGAPIWSKGFGGAGADTPEALAVDTQGNVVVAGSFTLDADFGAGSLTAAGTDIFVARYSGTDGRHQWSRRFGGNQDDSAQGLAIIDGTSVVLTGEFQGSINFGTGALGESEAGGLFLAKLSSLGIANWSKAFVRTNVTGAGCHGVAVDSNGNIAIVGFTAEPLNFGNGALSGVQDSGNDLFLAKFTSSGAPQWSRRFAGLGAEDGTAISFDPSGDVLATGTFTGQLDLEGVILSNTGGKTGFLIQFVP